MTVLASNRRGRRVWRIALAAALAVVLAAAVGVVIALSGRSSADAAKVAAREVFLTGLGAGRRGRRIRRPRGP